jgi:hypothetical protein
VGDAGIPRASEHSVAIDVERGIAQVAVRID